MIEIDLRGKSLEEVASLVKKNDLGSGNSSDITHLRQLINDNYVKVVCVWLTNMETDARDHLGRKLSKEFIFTLWDSRRRQPQRDQDLHGFIMADGAIEWGISRTLDLMR